MKTDISLVEMIAEYLRGKASIPVFTEMTKNPNYKGDYIGVNALLKSYRYIDTAIINVNIHVPDLMAGVANVKRIKELSAAILPHLNEVSTNGVWLYLKDSSSGGDTDGTHYQNYRIEVTHLNE